MNDQRDLALAWIRVGAMNTSSVQSVVFETARLRLRRANTDDAEFFLDLLNQPSFLKHIGDKGVRTIQDAREYLDSGPIASYEKFGFGLWIIEQKETGNAIGICGLLKRDALPDVDIGYALLPQYWSNGYAAEAAAATLKYARGVMGLRRILAVTSLENQSSIRLLERLGFRFQKLIQLSDGAEQTRLFVSELSEPSEKPTKEAKESSS